jgi:hypothetical protein
MPSDPLVLSPLLCSRVGHPALTNTTKYVKPLRKKQFKKAGKEFYKDS